MSGSFMTLGPSAARCAGSAWTIGGNPRSPSRSRRLPIGGSTGKRIGVFTLSDLVDRVVKTMKATELMWSVAPGLLARASLRNNRSVVRARACKTWLAVCCIMPPEPKAAATELRSLFLRYLAQKTPALCPDTLGLRLLATMPTECVICNRPISVMLRVRGRVF